MSYFLNEIRSFIIIFAITFLIIIYKPNMQCVLKQFHMNIQ
jgi:hypothetical protein